MSKTFSHVPCTQLVPCPRGTNNMGCNCKPTLLIWFSFHNIYRNNHAIYKRVKIFKYLHLHLDIMFKQFIEWTSGSNDSNKYKSTSEYCYKITINCILSLRSYWVHIEFCVSQQSLENFIGSNLQKVCTCFKWK